MAQSSKTLLVIQNTPVDPAGSVLPHAHEVGLHTTVIDTQAGDQVPLQADDVAGVVVMGGYMNAGDEAEYPYLLDELKLIQDCVDRDVPILGICLGAQLAARALGGSAYKGSTGPELGWHTITKTDSGEAEPILQGITKDSPLLQWHGQTFDLPPDATLLARSERYKQAYRLGSFIGVQFHPEVDETIIRQWHTDTVADADPEFGPVPPIEELVDDVASKTQAAIPVLRNFFLSL